MEKVFIEEVSLGEKARLIAYIFSLSDLALIKSLFESEQIPFFCEFEHLSRIKTGLPTQQVNTIILNVLEKDTQDSLLVLEEYSKNKQSIVPTRVKIRSLFEFFVISNAIPSAKMTTIAILGQTKKQSSH